MTVALLQEPALRILIVEDNTALSEGLAYLLRRVGHSITLAADGEAALRELASDEVDLLVLDFGLPKVHGSEVLRQVRARPAHLPVLLFSALHDVEARLSGLGLAADAYLAKPFSLREFESQITAMQRRFHPTPSDFVAFGPIRCDLSGGTVQVDGKALDVTAGERVVLELLVRHAGAAVGRDELAAQLPPPEGNVGADPVAACVAQLRGRLDQLPVRIATVRGLGYALVKA